MQRPSAPGACLLAVVVLAGAVAVDAVAHPHGAIHDPAAELDLFPAHQEVMARLDALEDHPWITVHPLGTSPEEREIRLVAVVDPEGTVPVAERAVTLFLTQQHGNEPAGTPAVLDLLEQIADGHEIKRTLSNQVLLVLPMANPDGSDAGSRGNADGVDTNRDHNHLETVEGAIMHSVLNEWTVHVALDHHEYGGTGLGNPFPVRVYDYDLTTLVPTHAGVHPAVMTMANNLMYDGIWPLAEDHGYTANEYGEVTAAGVPLGHLAGGPDPGILRNHLGLHHIAGILIETRIDAHDNPFHDAERRVHIQYLTMVATLEYVHAHAALFVAAREEATRSHAAAVPEWYDEGDWSSLTADPLSDGERPRERIPGAYLVGGDPEAVKALLAAHGLDPGVVVDDGVVVGVADGWGVHKAALFSAASSRQVMSATATEALAEGDEEHVPAQGDAEGAPGLPLVGVLFVVVAAAWGARRRARP